MGYKQVFLIIIEVLQELMEILDDKKGSRSLKMQELETFVNDMED